jgi:hypothetical protein
MMPGSEKFLRFYKKAIKSGPGRIRTFDQAVMLPAAAFAAPFGFVGWTIPSPAMGACRLVSTPSAGQSVFWTARGLARDYHTFR